jgi:hypothetical protein
MGAPRDRPGSRAPGRVSRLYFDPRLEELTISVKPQSPRASVLVGIKLLHTAVWLFFAGCIATIPIAGACRQFRWAAVLTGLVLFECAVLAVNRGRCPSTDLASRYTEARADNFDIYLPLWLAQHNKTIFWRAFRPWRTAPFLTVLDCFGMLLECCWTCMARDAAV